MAIADPDPGEPINAGPCGSGSDIQGLGIKGSTGNTVNLSTVGIIFYTGPLPAVPVP
jgi:hypothetical protein